MTNYMVIAGVRNVNFLVKVQATSLLAAEHMILDLGICGRHDYGVSGAQAFGAEEMKTDTFIFYALDAKTITFSELKKVIEEYNEEIRQADAKEKRIDEIEKEMKKLQAELEKLKK